MGAKVKSESVDLQQLAIWTAIAAVVSAVINAILFVVTSGQFDGALAMGQPFSVMPVIIASIAQIAVGGALLGVLDRFLDKPISTWRIVAIVVLVLTLAMPFLWLEGSPDVEGAPKMAARLILLTMHIIAGGITIYLLTTRTQKSS